MAGATPMAVLGQPTTLLVVQHRHTLPRARTQSPARQGWPHCGHPSIYPTPTTHPTDTHQHGAAIAQSCARSAREPDTSYENPMVHVEIDQFLVTIPRVWTHAVDHLS
jgi:hypothetical protein